MKTESNTRVILTAENTSGECLLKILSEKTIQSATLTLTAPDTGKTAEYTFAGGSRTVAETFRVENPVLWELNSPSLYDYTVVVNYGGETETIRGRFGIRTLGQNGKNITLNGTPIFIRGYIRGARAHEHLNDEKLPEAEFYRKNIRQAKKFGFNYIRFHSVVPNEVFFRVADEEGILVHIELRAPDDEYENLKEMTSTEKSFMSKDFVVDTVFSLCDHPSLAVYCVGNEIKGDKQKFAEEIHDLILSLDKSRLFLDTCAWGKNNRKGIDFDVQHMSYYFPYGKHADMFDDTDNLLVCGVENDAPTVVDGDGFSLTRDLHFDVPLLAHEVCHYCALRDFAALKAKFEKYGTPAPWWIDEELKMMKAKGLAENYDELYAASKYFQQECFKVAFEGIRRSSVLGGYMFLQFADTDAYENSNGIVDCFDDINYIKPEKFLTFNGDVVVVAKLAKNCFFAGEEVEIPVILSNCGTDDVSYADFSFALTGEDGTAALHGEMPGISVRKKGRYSILRLKLRIPEVGRAEKFVLRMTLKGEKGFFTENSWNLWCFKKTAPLAYGKFVNYREDGIVITDSTAKALRELRDGKKVCLVYRSDYTRHLLHKDMEKPEYAFRATWSRFKPVIWDRGTNFGGLCEKDLLNRYGFSTERFYDLNYAVISEDCDKIDLTDFPVKVRSIVSGIDKDVRDRFDAGKEFFNLPELQYDRTMRDFSYLFELKAGEGSLLVCGFNMTGLDNNEPSTRAMAEFIIDYMKSPEFAPRAQLSLKELKDYLKKCAQKPVKERMMTQFWQLDDTPVESNSYWKESEEYLKTED